MRTTLPFTRVGVASGFGYTPDGYPDTRDPKEPGNSNQSTGNQLPYKRSETREALLLSLPINPSN